MNHGYSRVYTPVLRNPNLFHQNTIRSSPRNFPSKYVPIPSGVLNSYQYPSSYAPQFPNNVPPPMPYYLQSSNPYQKLTLPGSPSPSQLPFYSYSMPTYSYAPTASSKGLSLILIATLILVALDLVLVRPQKSRPEVQGSMSTPLFPERLTL